MIICILSSMVDGVVVVFYRDGFFFVNDILEEGLGVLEFLVVDGLGSFVGVFERNMEVRVVGVGGFYWGNFSCSVLNLML